MHLQSMRKPSAERIDIRRPQMRNKVHNAEPDGDRKGKDEWTTARQPGRRHSLARLISRGFPRLARDAVDHPGQDDAEEGTVAEVYGEAVAAEEEEETF